MQFKHVHFVLSSIKFSFATNNDSGLTKKILIAENIDICCLTFRFPEKKNLYV